MIGIETFIICLLHYGTASVRNATPGIILPLAKHRGINEVTGWIQVSASLCPRSKPWPLELVNPVSEEFSEKALVALLQGRQENLVFRNVEVDGGTADARKAIV